MADHQRPYLPTPPYPQQGGSPRPAGVPPTGGAPRPVGVPPMGGMPHPAGVPPMGGMPRPAGVPPTGGMPRPAGVPPTGGMPRPAGVPPMGGMPPMGGVRSTGMPPVFPENAVVPPEPPVFPGEDEASVDELWDDDLTAEVDENGFIDDLEMDEPEAASENKDEGQEESEYDSNPYERNFASDLGLPPVFVRTKMIVFLFLLFFSFGGAFGYFATVFQKTAEGEMPGVVYNSEIPKGRPRCGIAQKGQGCVLYLMNAQRREMDGREFFTMASDILGVPKFQVETANIRYATMRIPPGYIALINIPPL